MKESLLLEVGQVAEFPKVQGFPKESLLLEVGEGEGEVAKCRGLLVQGVDDLRSCVKTSKIRDHQTSWKFP